VVCTLLLILESFDSSKIPYELWNIMFYYSSFCLQRLHQFVCTTSWVVIVVVFTNLLPKCVAFLAISYYWTCKKWKNEQKIRHFSLRKKIFPFYLFVEVSNAHVVSMDHIHKIHCWHTQKKIWFGKFKFYYDILMHWRPRQWFHFFSILCCYASGNHP